MAKLPLFILIILSFAISRLLFLFINDPEGPNLLIVAALAVLIFVPLYLTYVFVSKKRKVK